MSRAIFITQRGRPEKLRFRSIPTPTPGPNEVHIRTRAIGVNFADIVARRGLYPGAPARPFIPGYEVAGIVEAVGEGVSGLEPGQRVVALIRFGAYSTDILTSEQGVLPLPETVPFTDAAALPLNFVTAYHSLFHTGLVRPGARVLIHAASGGVGLAAVQLAQNAGAEIFGVVGNDRKVSFLREFGVEHPINHAEQDFASEVSRLTDGEGVDVILDSVGGRQLRQDLRLLRPAGRLVLLGIASLIGKSRPGILLELLRIPRPHPLRLLDRSQSICGVNLNRLMTDPELLRETLAHILDLYLQGEIRPVVVECFPWEEVVTVHRMMENREHIGKIVLTVE